MLASRPLCLANSAIALDIGLLNRVFSFSFLALYLVTDLVMFSQIQSVTHLKKMEHLAASWASCSPWASGFPATASLEGGAKVCSWVLFTLLLLLSNA